MPIQHITAGNVVLQATQHKGPLIYERSLYSLPASELAQIIKENYTPDKVRTLAAALALQLGLVIGPAQQTLAAQLQAITPTQLVEMLTEVWDPDQRWEFGVKFTDSFKW